MFATVGHAFKVGPRCKVDGGMVTRSDDRRCVYLWPGSSGGMAKLAFTLECFGPRQTICVPRNRLRTSPSTWSVPTTTQEVVRRAAGRRTYNARRQFDAAARRIEVLKMLRQYGLSRGTQAKIARTLGVHPSTIARDVRILFGPVAPEAETEGT